MAWRLLKKQYVLYHFVIPKNKELKTMSKKNFISISIIIMLNLSAYAQEFHTKGISLDGSIGSTGKLELQGPDFDIKAEYSPKESYFSKEILASNILGTFSIDWKLG